MNPETAAPSASRPLEVALLASVFVVAACGLVYELAAGALASYLLEPAAPSWDKVMYGGGAGDGEPSRLPGLGCVDAQHQSLQSMSGATVLTYYRAFGIDPARRQTLYEQPWTH